MKVEIINPTKDESRIVEGLQEDIDAKVLQDLVIRTTSREAAVYFAAINEGRVVGLVGFRQHRLASDGSDHIIAFQAVGVITSRDYRGKGIFPEIVRSAESLLQSQGGQMIFGFPNEKAYPIWTKKLDYGQVPLFKWRAPLGLGLSSFVNDARSGNLPVALHADDEDIVASKQTLYGNDLLSVANDDSVAWGVKRSITKFGMNFVMLDIGGIRCRDAEDFKFLLGKLKKKARDAKGIRLLTTATNPVLQLLRLARPSPFAHEVVIYKWLSPEERQSPPLAFSSGMTDWF